MDVHSYSPSNSTQSGVLASLWGQLYRYFDEDDYMIFLTATGIISFATFWGMCFLFLYVDITGKPAFLAKYKIQPKEKLDLKQLYRAMPIIMFNQLGLSIPSFFAWYYIARWRGCSFGYDVPSLWEITRDVAVAQLIQEIGFYYSHRLWHHPWFYKRIHKLHHEWTAPVGPIAVYLHPIEYFISGIVVAQAGPILMKSHLVTTLVWLTLALVVTTTHHSGYHFPLLPSSEFHDFHHLKFNTCFGIIGLCDWLHGTDKLFRQSSVYDRHKVLLGVTPLSQSIPDHKKL
ncbi:fatty acid hydroxylase domain-containing protein 2-like [Glandiceps talaboti]